MVLRIGLLLFLFSSSCSFGQQVKKENLSKQKQTFWDYNKLQIQSQGKYYVDQFGETTEKHGKWLYYDRKGTIEEVRNYYRDMLHGEVVLYYSNGQKRQLGYFKQNQQDSIYTEWFETGNVKVEGEYNADQAANFWRYYYRDGRLKSLEEIREEENYLWEFYLPDSAHTQTVIAGTGELVSYYTTGRVKEWYNYKEGLKDGPFEEFSIYGYSTLKGNFKGGLKNGKWEYAYYTGDKEKVTNYKDGLLHGAYTFFYDNGTVYIDGRFENGEKQGEWTWFTNKGTKDMTGVFKNGQQDGKWTYWYPTGELSYTAHYLLGAKTGTWTYLYKNGSKFKQGPFEDNLKNGKWKTWYEDGTILMEGNYSDGKEEGEWRNYWENGNLKNKTSFASGELEGEWLSFYPNGNQNITGRYSANMKLGEWLEFFENGKPKELSTFKLFKLKSKRKYGFTKDRVVLESKIHGPYVSYSAKDYGKTEEGEYKKGLKEGKWTAYHPGGVTHAVVSHYKNGELHGAMKQYSRRGEILQEMEYKDGLKHGSFIMYDAHGKAMVKRQYVDGMQIIEGKTNTPGVFTPGK